MESCTLAGLVGYDEAERITGIARSTLFSMVSRRLIPHHRLSKRLVKFDPRDLRAWIDERRVEVTGPKVARARGAQ